MPSAAVSRNPEPRGECGLKRLGRKPPSQPCRPEASKKPPRQKPRVRGTTTTTTTTTTTINTNHENHNNNNNDNTNTNKTINYDNDNVQGPRAPLLAARFALVLAPEAIAGREAPPKQTSHLFKCVC